MLAAFFFALILQASQPSSPPASPQAAAGEYPSIKNFLRINPDFCTGGQPSMDDLVRLKAEGVRSILNLRRGSEHNAEEEAQKAKELGLRYFNIPVNSADLKDEQVEEFLKLLADPDNRPVFIHCATNNRVGAFWMIRRVLVDHWSLDAAEAEARRMGTHSQALFEFARAYLARRARR